MRGVGAFAVKAVFSVLLVSVMLGVSGCMSNVNESSFVDKKNSAVVKEQIQLQLTQKYDTAFTVQSVSMEFNGQDGMYYRATCNSQDYADTFTVYCYESTEQDTTAFAIGDHLFMMQDNYAEVILQNYLLGQLGEYDAQSVFVGCKISFDAEQPDAQLLQGDLDACLQNADAYIKFYFVSGGADVQLLCTKAVELLNKNNPYRGYIYVVDKLPFDAAAVAQTYAENQHDYGNYLNNTDYANRIVFILYKAGEGIQPAQVIKE